MSTEAEPLIGFGGRKAPIGLKKEKTSWIYTPPHKAPPAFSDFDENRNTLNIEQQLFRGLKIQAINILSRDHSFRVQHEMEIGKKEGIDQQTGKKDGNRSGYSLRADLHYKNFALTAVAVPSRLSQIIARHSGDRHSMEVVGQFFGGRSGFALAGEYKIRDMCFDGQVNFNQMTSTIGFTQPITSKLQVGTSLEVHPLGDRATLSLLAKYKESPDANATIGIKTGGGVEELSMTYAQNILPNLKVIVANDLSLAKKSPFGGEKEWASVLKGGYVYHDGMVMIRAVGDNTGNLQATVFLGEMMLSSNVNVLKNTYEFGVAYQNIM